MKGPGDGWARSGTDGRRRGGRLYPSSVAVRRPPRPPALTRPSVRDAYLVALWDATTRPARGEPDAALHAFLTLNAGYFLGEWLTAREHRALIRRLAVALDGLADLRPPADPAHAAQLAQHVRELAAEFGPTPWTMALAGRTSALVPDRAEDWDGAVGEALARLIRDGDAHPLLLAHARRRLWALTHPSSAAGGTPAPATAVRRLARATARSSGHLIQAGEAALAEGQVMSFARLLG
jgi:hypothetical protein